METRPTICLKTADYNSLHQFIAEHGEDSFDWIGDEGEYVSFKESQDEIIVIESQRNGWKKIMRFPR